MSEKRKILITCALPYANGPIHIGHMLEHIEADIYTRFQKMYGNECLFFCADDTHGTPIMIAAQKAGVTPEAWVEKSFVEHQEDFKKFAIQFDHYSSTNSTENKELCEYFYKQMKSKGHVATKNIEQLYCEHDKMFLPDRFVKGTCPKCGALDQYGDSCDICGATYSPEELKNPGCSICKTKPVKKPSSHIFFKLNDFKNFLTNWLPEHTSSEVGKKMSEWFNEDLRDWDISRDAPYFGFQIPGEENKFFYVWVDAPMGYVSTAAQYLKKNNRNLEEFWGKDSKAEVYHFIGKDIVYFHTLFWPALLESAGFRTPTKVNVHGHIMVNGEKMSKSKGTFVSASVFAKHLNPQHLRYYYATKINATIDDLDLSFDDYQNRINSELVGKIVNLASRGAQMINKKFNNQMISCDVDGLKLVQNLQSHQKQLAEFYNQREFNKATTLIRELAEQTNKYFDEKAPWKLIESNPLVTHQILTSTLNAFRILAIYLKPVLPEMAHQVSELFGEGDYSWSQSQEILENRTIQTYVHLASRVEKDKVQAMLDEQKEIYEKSNPTPPAAAKKKSDAPATGPKTEIDFSDFEKIDLRLVEVIEAEEIAEADKLLRLKVSLGDGTTKQVISGIKSAYSAKDVLGRKLLMCVNLKPRKMKFGVSEGMILAAGDGGKDLFLLSADQGAKTGSVVK